MSEQPLASEVADYSDGSLAFVDTVNGGLSKQGQVRTRKGQRCIWQER